ncbi:hypothetical protein GALMADRAFT_257261 [Galerina marginata CBS 339.88]|uniref:Uncharacterized protein n=1 Tax=Galerina marginata (strain CBS 339.88) TaxID=685588 RepID=A0A067SKK8_GALM3|nr:hypothetical protein GALMADRAFT_257261 [Galerina marginata CBS 339.88]
MRRSGGRYREQRRKMIVLSRGDGEIGPPFANFFSHSYSYLYASSSSSPIVAGGDGRRNGRRAGAMTDREQMAHTYPARSTLSDHEKTRRLSMSIMLMAASLRVGHQRRESTGADLGMGRSNANDELQNDGSPHSSTKDPCYDSNDDARSACSSVLSRGNRSPAKETIIIRARTCVTISKRS